MKFHLKILLIGAQNALYFRRILREKSTPTTTVDIFITIKNNLFQKFYYKICTKYIK